VVGSFAENCVAPEDVVKGCVVPKAADGENSVNPVGTRIKLSDEAEVPYRKKALVREA
jgi:hypothetical protein